jgi:hypothetical protein
MIQIFTAPRNFSVFRPNRHPTRAAPRSAAASTKYCGRVSQALVRFDPLGLALARPNQAETRLIYPSAFFEFFVTTNSAKSRCTYFDSLGFTLTELFRCDLSRRCVFATRRPQPEIRLSIPNGNGLIYYDSVGFRPNTHRDSG